MRAPEELLVRVRIQLGRDGKLSAPPMVLTNGHSPLFLAARESAVRAVLRGQPYDMLSPNTYDAWKDLEIHLRSAVRRVFRSCRFAHTAWGGAIRPTSTASGPDCVIERRAGGAVDCERRVSRR